MELDSKDSIIYQYTLLFLYTSSIPTLISLRFIQAPYGKHHRPGWGPTMSPPLAWFLMESPTIWLTLLLYPLGRHSSSPRSLALIAPFLIHYLHRTIIYPIRLSRRKIATGFPVSVAGMAVGFNMMNAYLQTRCVSHYNVEDYGSDEWFWWRFTGGMVIFVGGMAVNIWADLVLMGLKRSGGGGYKVPLGGLFGLVSCPNYLGEILEWLGWAFMTWSWAGFGFLLYTCANLVPRARANHMWYLDKFGEDYPKNRKAAIPFLY